MVDLFEQQGSRKGSKRKAASLIQTHPHALSEALTGWYRRARRTLPWREDPAPYRVWVSEIMLQQTQVVTVIPYFERFMSALPDVEALARASEETVLTLWSGLGYYRRARLMHKAAKVIVETHGGRIPDSVDALLSLPGIGRYTAGAIASIAYGVKAPLLDGNVARVLSRIFAIEDEVNAPAGEKRLWALAESLVPERDPSAHNQALMELGALVCSPRSPSCLTCPVSDQCAAFARDEVEHFPRKKARAEPTRVSAVSALIFCPAQEKILVARRPADTLLGGLWELPGGELEAPRAPRKRTLTALLKTRLGVDIEAGDLVGEVLHQFTHRTLTLELFLAKTASERVVPLAFYDDARWVPLDRVASEVPVSTLTRKVLDLIDKTGVRS